MPNTSSPTVADVENYFDTLLNTSEIPDYAPAHNGLQVARRPDRPVRLIAAAVDASEAVLRDAAARDVDLLVVHHGIFWSGSAPITGVLHRKLALLFEHDFALYASHLPLDGHPEFGNSARLIRALGFEPQVSFGSHQGFGIGWRFEVEHMARSEMIDRIAQTVGGPVHAISGGPETIRTAAVVTGAGGAFIAEAARSGIDLLVTGEGAHHTFAEAHEHGINVVYAGHYATETWGVRALVEHAADRWSIESIFLDHPSGL